MTETEVDEATICADLARAIWPKCEVAVSVFDGVAVKPELGKWRNFNPFGNAAASRELVEWLAKDDDRWYDFETTLALLLTPPNFAYTGTRPTVQRAMTAPLATIARAAHAAIKGEKNESAHTG